jgi:hypothetical protein
MKSLSVSGIGPNGSRLIDWSCSLGGGPCQSLDQRVKFPVWRDKFEERGRKLILHEATIEDAERYVEESDLLIVAVGKGDLGKLFQRDPSRSPFDAPQRDLLLLFVNGMVPREDDATGGLSVIPGIGEYLCFRALTTTGECDIMLFEAVMGAPWTTGNPAPPSKNTSTKQNPSSRPSSPGKHTATKTSPPPTPTHSSEAHSPRP